MGLKHIAISADGYPNEYGVVGRNTKNPCFGDVVVPPERVVDFKDGTVEITVPVNVPSGFYRLQSKGR